MKLCTFEMNSPLGRTPRLGLKTQKEKILDLNLAYALMLAERDGHLRARELADVLVPPDMSAWLKNERFGRQAVDEAVDYLGARINGDDLRGPRGEKLLHGLEEVRLLAPLPRPSSMRDCALFMEHVKKSMERSGRHEELKQLIEIQKKLPVVYYKGNPASVVGPDSDIVMHPGETRHDYECEVCCVIGRTGRDIPPDKVWDHLAGFTIFNDVSGRDMCGLEIKSLLGLAKGKDKDGWNQMGPYLVTPDEWDFRDE
ncbi:MAG: fumarylacetoacetate hydrolase family protein, partial [Pseudomonadota bacterium]